MYICICAFLHTFRIHEAVVNNMYNILFEKYAEHGSGLLLVLPHGGAACQLLIKWLFNMLSIYKVKLFMCIYREKYNIWSV